MRLHSLVAAAVALVVVLANTSSPAQPRLGTIRGRVDVKRIIQPVERRPSASDTNTTPPPREIPDQRRTVVYLERGPAAALESREPVRARMDQRNETFLPHVLTIDQGTVVDFPNNDTTYHNVFSISKPRKFDLGRYARGKSKSLRFDQPGVVRIFCDIHSHMSAFVLVFNHPYYSKADPDGRYRIDNVPPGTYMVSAWHEGDVHETKMVTVPPQGGDVDLDFTVQ